MATIRSTIQLQDRMSPVFSSITKAMNSTLAAIRSVQGADLGEEFARAAADVRLAEEEIRRMNEGLRDVPPEAGRAGDGFTVMKGLAVSALVAIGRAIKDSVGDVIRLTDQLTSSAARIGLIAGEGESVASIQQDIFEAAQRSRGEYLGMLDTVSKLRLQAPDAFASTKEAVYFAEQLNKQFTVSGTSASGVESVMYNLTQALSSGVLRGQDLNAVFSNAPSIIQAIADELGVPIGEIRAMAAEGELSASIIKNAMFNAAEETNAQFEKMPMTIGQMWTHAKNEILMAVQPLLEGLAEGARFIYDNWSTIEPILVGIASGVLIAAAAWGVYTAATWLAVAANRELIISMLTNPYVMAAVAIGLIVAAIYRWIQAVGGIQIAWLMFANYFITHWENIQFATMTGVYAVMDFLDQMKLGWKAAGVGIANFVGKMHVDVLSGIQSMVNGAIDLINQFIDAVSTIPGINIKAIEHVTFATKAAVTEEAARQGREAELSALSEEVTGRATERAGLLETMKSEILAARTSRADEIARLQNEAAAKAAEGTDDWMSNVTSGSGSGAAVKTKGEVNIASEDIKMLLDLATRDRQIIYQTLTPQLSLNVDTIRETADVAQLMEYFADEVEEMANASLVYG